MASVEYWKLVRIGNICGKEFPSVEIFSISFSMQDREVSTWDSRDLACCRSCTQPVPVDPDMNVLDGTIG